MDELTLKITGMSCGHCVGQVTKALTRLDGVQVHSVKVGEAIVVYDPGTRSHGDYPGYERGGV